MKKLCLLIGFILTATLSFAQEDIEYKEYSYTEFFQMIEAEEDSIFRLENALIIPDIKTDQRFLIPYEKGEDYWTERVLPIPNRYDSIVINKELILENIRFEKTRGQHVFLHHIRFEKSVRMINVLNFNISDCLFLERLRMFLGDTKDQITDRGPNLSKIQSSLFRKGLDHGFGSNEEPVDAHFVLVNSKIYGGDFGSWLIGTFFRDYEIYDNQFIDSWVNIRSGKFTEIINNHFELGVSLDNTFSNSSILQIEDNTIQGYAYLDIRPNENTVIDWVQFRGKSMTGSEYAGLTSMRDTQMDSLIKERDAAEGQRMDSLNRLLQDIYFNKLRFKNDRIYKAEQRFKGKFINFYKSQNDLESANMVYVESKDIETKRLAYLYEQNSTFKTFFKWRINQFLKIFSAYGTEPERAIVFSVYVILAFALVYLFFPNHWDSHGKNRIIDRFSFFLKYMKKDAGMHDVYLEEKQGDILAYDEYKQLLESSGKDVPKFFQATGLPLYKWAISGTKLTAGFLSRIDVMKGTWSELPQSKRVWKSVLLISAFLIALTYDIFIKMLNALMLSINTFTTLGFGEIPIKGLPRYLAIIQGFIGWFMLTIFSVSLISQLLN